MVVADINSGDASRVAEAIVRQGGRAEARQVDVSSEDAVRQTVEETAASHGRLDYLFNNAGIGIGGDARDLTCEHWRRVLGVDLFGVIYGTLAAYPIMTRQGFGHIVNTSSSAGPCIHDEPATPRQPHPYPKPALGRFCRTPRTAKVEW